MAARSAADHRSALWVLRIAVVACFLGRAWQHLRWDAPFRAVLWDQELMEGPVRFLLGLSWEEYTVPRGDEVIQAIIRGFGVFYLICAVAAVAAGTRRKWPQWFLVAGGLGLLSLSLLQWKDHGLRFGDLIEHASQWTAPLILVAFLRARTVKPWLSVAARLAIVGTFLGHGLYAIGFYETPGDFRTMLINVLGVGERQAAEALRIAGILDFLVCVGVFVPVVEVYALGYAVIWGGLTALARLWAGFSWDFPVAALDQYLFEVLVRLPHAGLPLFLLMFRRIRA